MSNNLKMNNFMFNVKQLKMNEFIKYIWQLIISTLNATLEVPSLHPCVIARIDMANVNQAFFSKDFMHSISLDNLE